MCADEKMPLDEEVIRRLMRRLEAAGERALQESAATIRRVHEVLTEEWGHGRWKPARAR